MPPAEDSERAVGELGLANLVDVSRSGNQRRDQNRRYMVLRFAIILLGFCLVTVYQMGLEPTQKAGAFRFLYLVLGSYLVVAIASLVAARRWAQHGWFAFVQVSIDFAFGALLTSLTGGVLSIFCPLVFVTLFSACTVLRWRSILFFAALATSFLAVITLGNTLGWIPVHAPRLRWLLQPEQLGFVGTYLIGVGVALHLVALLGGQLSTGLLRVQHLQAELLDNIGEGLVAIDRDDRIVQINNEARSMLEIDVRGPVVGRNLREVLDAELHAPVLELLSRQGRQREELRLELPSGRSLELEAKVSTTADASGRFRMRVALFSDLALKKEVEAQERRIHQLEQLYQMALGIAHEIRNPLASIRGCVQEVGKLEMRSDASRRLVDIVCRESDRLDQIIEDFLSFTRKQPRPSRPVELTQLVEATAVLLERHPERAARRVRCARSDEPAWVLGDGERLRQIVLNLGLNALEATDPQTGEVTLSVTNAIVGGAPRVLLRVEDNGEGVDDGDITRIFAPFFTTRERGTGLGLALVHRFVHDHEGTVSVQSESGGGTTFTISFPAVTAGAGAEVTAVEADRAPHLVAATDR